MHLAVVGFWEVMGRMKLNFFDVLDKYNIETVNVWNQVLLSSVLASLHAATKVLSQIWGPPFCPHPPAGGYGEPFLRLWFETPACS